MRIDTPAGEPADTAADSGARSASAVTPSPGDAHRRTPGDNGVPSTRLDRRFAVWVRTPVGRRLWFIAAPLAIIALAALLRFWNLAHPQSLVFDETYYVKDAWTLANNGYESAWPEGADERFAAGETDIFRADPSYVVHPPLGKWIIAAGMGVFGPESAFAWRATTALLGTLAVPLLMLITRRLLGSHLLALLAGLLFAIDGHAIVMARVAILDNSVMFFALLGFGAIMLDRESFARRLTERVAASRLAGREPEWGPAIWARPWLLAAGLAFGATTAVKWSGLYFLAAFGLYTVIADAVLRRQLELPAWFSGAVVRQGPVSFLLLVPVAAVTYLASWSGWLLSRGGYFRDWAEQDGNAWTGPFAFVPRAIQSLIHYHESAYGYHVRLSSPHGYQANPLGWTILQRPTSMYYVESEGCIGGTCSSAITAIGNPLIWWAGTAAVLVLLYLAVRHMDGRYALILMGLVAGYLPWWAYTNRTVFQFYAIAFEPYILLALVAVAGYLLGRPDDPEKRRRRGLWIVGGFVALALLLSAFWYPLWTGTAVPKFFWQMHNWFITWV